LSDLTNRPAFPNNPSGSNYVTSFEAPVDWADNYGTRMRGYVVPPTAGPYTFWISSDDNSILYLSDDETSSRKAAIASVATWTLYGMPPP
jgi:hypothetical protein